jgi:hypothetical protein
MRTCLCQPESKYDGVIAALQPILYASVHYGRAAVGYKERTYPRASSKTSGMTHY